MDFAVGMVKVVAFALEFETGPALFGSSYMPRDLMLCHKNACMSAHAPHAASEMAIHFEEVQIENHPES
jgi:hypothetical protein